MSGQRPGGPLAGIGGWCFRNRWLIIALWLVAAVLGGSSMGSVYDRLVDDSNPRSLESVRAYSVLSEEDDTGGPETGGQVIGLVDSIDPTDPTVLGTVATAVADLGDLPEVQSAVCPCQVGAAEDAAMAAMLSSDGTAMLVVITLEPFDTVDRTSFLEPVISRLHQLEDDLASAGLAEATVRVGGNPVLNDELNATVQQDLTRAELISLPVTLVALVVVFGGLVAAGLPVVAAVVSVLAAMTVLLGFSYLTDLDQNAVTVVTLLGLGLSIDYGLLLVARYREELAGGNDPDVAVARAWATAGRTILFSALTVAAALSGLMMFSISAISALGAAGISIAVVAMLAALTLTAALLGATKRWITPRRRRLVFRRGAAVAEEHAPDRREQDRREQDRDPERGFFAVLARIVQRRPITIIVATTCALILLAAPLWSIVIRIPQLESVSENIESVVVSHALDDRFGWTEADAITIVARTGPEELGAWAARWEGEPGVSGVAEATAEGPGLSSVDVTLSGDPQGELAQQLVERMRDDRPAGVESWVTGEAAVLVDVVDLILDDLPAAIGVTLASMVLLLFAMTGSLVIPVKAILANVVSLGASFGVVVLVFQEGHGEGILHTNTVGGINPFVMVIIFSFAFALSMDYEVFLLGRIKEYVDGGLDTDAAVRRGLQRTGQVITSAALLMMIVVGSFATADIGNIEQIGIGLTAAVFIDATLVRCLLVPSTMTVLGRWNWWAPGPLRRVHRRIGLAERSLDLQTDTDRS